MTNIFGTVCPGEISVGSEGHIVSLASHHSVYLKVRVLIEQKLKVIVDADHQMPLGSITCKYISGYLIDLMYACICVYL